MMSKKCKYAIKSLVYLAKNIDKGNVRTANIATEEHIPRKFLEQILLELKFAGLVDSKQGFKGGYFLIKEPNEITVADVFRLFDGAIALVPCVAHERYEKCDDCTDEENCTIRREFAVIREETRKVMKNTTIHSFLP